MKVKAYRFRESRAIELIISEVPDEIDIDKLRKRMERYGEVWAGMLCNIVKAEMEDENANRES